MNTSLSLHTLARRYCLNQHAYWCERYSELVRKGEDRQSDGYNYTSAALATFPRYNVLNAIRVEVERIDPTELDDIEKTRALLVLAGETAEDDFTRQPISEVDARAMTEEREAFCRYIGATDLSSLSEVERLPYRRVLSTTESQAIWSRLRGRWQIAEEHWHPLAECTLADVVAFKAGAFDEAVGAGSVRGILAARGIERVWELREYGPDCEEEVSLMQPHYNGSEGYWSSGDLEWIIYASHESSVTVGGWLLREVKRIWPPWHAHVWTGVFDFD